MGVGGIPTPPPPDKKTFPEPDGWPSIKTTYETTLHKKIKDAQAAGVSTADISAGIDYWIACLLQDKNAVTLG